MLLSILVTPLLCMIIAFVSYKFGQIEVHSGFKNKFISRIVVVVVKFFRFASLIGSLIGIESEPIMFQKFLASIEVPRKEKKNDSIKIIDTFAGDVPIRIYKPKSEEKRLPVLIFYHGGSFVIGTPNQYYALNYQLAKKLNFTLIFIDYRLAPRNAYPTPLNDSLEATTYILNRADEFEIDLEKVILAGDSAGGCLCAVISQKLMEQNLVKPKLQVLIYPWLQHFDFNLPSQRQHANSKYSITGISLIKMILWALGEEYVTDEMENAIRSCSHTLLIDNLEERRKLANYLDLDLIPEEYKTGLKYYKNAVKLRESSIFNSSIEDNILKNENFAKTVKKLFDPEISPGLFDDKKLEMSPDTYMVVCEHDTLKDENLIYAERLKRNGVPTTVSYYDEGYHGMLISVDNVFPNSVSIQILDDLVKFIKAKFEDW